MSSTPSQTEQTGRTPRGMGPNPRAQTFFHVMNRVLDLVLRSPAHRLVSNSLLLVEFTGRKSGKRYRTPVGYRRHGSTISFHTDARWVKNLRDGAPVRLWLSGKPVDSTAQLVTDDAMVARELAPILQRAPRLAKFYGVRMEPDGKPNTEDLATLAHRVTVVSVEAAGQSGRPKSWEVLDAADDVSMRGKVVMITGANTGIGKATALALAKKGATVVMVSRRRAKGEMAAEEVIARSGNPHVELLVADLASQEAVRKLAHDFLARHSRLDALVNNAGVFMPKRVLTADGLETTFATNYLAPFLLTHLLLPALEAAAPSRIVNVSSMAQSWGRLDFANLQGEKRYSGMRAYAQSKLALITWTYELARRLSGTGVTVNVLEPGFVDTKLPSDMIPLPSKVGGLLARPFMTTPAEGAATSVYLTSSPRAESHNGNFFSSLGRPVRSVKQSYDRDVAQRLWQESEQLTGATAATPSAIAAGRKE